MPCTTGATRPSDRTLAFCVSTAHADFMAERFRQEGIRAAAVYAGSSLDRGAALEARSAAIFRCSSRWTCSTRASTCPAIDTVMMLRPTESKILFLQQLGRGLRRHPGKRHLVVLDFIGNHKGFLNKPQALFDCGSRYQDLAAFGRRVRDGQLKLPPGCFANYDLAIIDFLTRLNGKGLETDYQALKESAGRRPTLTEVYRASAKLRDLRRTGSHWWALVRDQGDLEPDEAGCLRSARGVPPGGRDHGHDPKLQGDPAGILPGARTASRPRRESRTSPTGPCTSSAAAAASSTTSERTCATWTASTRPSGWRYWSGNPINAWTGGNRKSAASPWFEVRDGHFAPTFAVADDERAVFQGMVQELVDYRLAAYEPRLASGPEVKAPAEPPEVEAQSAEIIPFRRPTAPPTDWQEVPYFPDLRIACGHFRAGSAETHATCHLAPRTWPPGSPTPLRRPSHRQLHGRWQASGPGWRLPAAGTHRLRPGRLHHRDHGRRRAPGSWARTSICCAWSPRPRMAGTSSRPRTRTIRTTRPTKGCRPGRD